MLTVSLLTLGDPGQVTGGYLYHRRMAEAASDHGARILFASFPVRPFPFATLDAGTVVRQALDRGVDILLVDSIAAALLGPWLSMHRLDLPLAAIVHQPPGGIDHDRLRTRLQALLDRMTYRRARRLLVASDALAAEFKAAGFRPEDLRVVPPGRDVARVLPTPKEDLRDGRLAALLSVGNWVRRKDLLALLEAFAGLPEQAATLHLVGDDSAEPGYARFVHARLGQRDLAGRVRVHGALPRERVAVLYRSADVFVLPSLKEPYGTVYGEAMTFGLPVVGWRAGNLPYLVRDTQEGLLLAPGDIDGLTRALHRLATDERLRAELGEAARRRAMQLPTWEQSAALFFGELDELAAAG